MLTFIQSIRERFQLHQLLLITTCLLLGMLQPVQAQFAQKQKIVAGDRDSFNFFSNSLDISGNYAIIGALNTDTDANNANPISDAGAAYIFELQPNGQFIQKQKLVASDRAQQDYFGEQAVISGNYAAVGAHWCKTDANGANPIANAGAVYIFERQGDGQWTQVAKLVEPDRGANHNFGNALAISGDFIIAGSYNNTTDGNGGNPLTGAGAAFVFQRQPNGQWTQVAKLLASDRRSGLNFGKTVALDNNYAVIGSTDSYDAQGNNFALAAGSAYVFVRQPNGQWQQQAKLVANDRSAGSYFSTSLSISGNYIGVGAPYNTTDQQNGNALTDAGSAYLFEQINGQWQQVSKVTAPDRAANDRFGMSVALSGSTFLVGSPSSAFDPSGGNPIDRSGGAYFYKRQPNGSWNLANKTVANDRTNYNFFGQEVALEGDMALIGAYYNSTDIAGGEYKYGAGTTYLFTPQSVANQAPYVSQPIGNQEVQFGSNYNFVIPANTFTDPEGQPLTLSATGLPNGVTLNGNTLSGPPLALGDYTITIKATDTGGLFASTSYMLQVKQVVNPPQPGNLQLIAPLYNCQTGAFTFQTTGGNGTTIEFRSIGITDWTTNPNQFVDTELRMAADAQPLLLRARQNGQEVTYIWNIRAQCPVGPNSPPFYTGNLVNQVAQQNSPFSYVLPGNVFSDPENQVMTLTAWGLPNGISLNGMTLSGVPTQSGSFQVSIQATDSGGLSAAGLFTLTVNPANGGGNGLQLVAPQYNCQTGAFTFQTTGGNGTSIEFRSIGITDWTTNPNQFVDLDLRTAADAQPLLLRARQSGQEVTYIWDIRAQCPVGARLAANVTTESIASLKAGVYPNPVGEEFTVTIDNAQDQSVRLFLTDLNGRPLLDRAINVTTLRHEERLRIGQAISGMYLLRVSTARETMSIKVIKQ
ncbi:T9SS type A sorting domain-containing protein [Spirosoma sp. BT702]|uniref:T9SS type A sorting domain-containing protein n=1 Tax=Spirosoma profusum TaxID=2771354 RepID=A0A926Y382_9BACT|nr:putative Ig domain-containing protein [Spirosoma profusum]MBD2703787.1 T9SS type A sorting domain-containing protein [Spirosoma profusum]